MGKCFRLKAAVEALWATVQQLGNFITALMAVLAASNTGPRYVMVSSSTIAALTVILHTPTRWCAGSAINAQAAKLEHSMMSLYYVGQIRLVSPIQNTGHLHSDVYNHEEAVSLSADKTLRLSKLSSKHTCINLELADWGVMATRQAIQAKPNQG